VGDHAGFQSGTLLGGKKILGNFLYLKALTIPFTASESCCPSSVLKSKFAAGGGYLDDGGMLVLDCPPSSGFPRRSVFTSIGRRFWYNAGRAHAAESLGWR